MKTLAVSDKIKIVAGLDPSPAGAAFAREAGIAFTDDFAAVLSDDQIDAVLLCTPHKFHAEQIVQVASAGKHVFCEKPLCLTRADVERVVAICRDHGVRAGRRARAAVRAASA